MKKLALILLSLLILPGVCLGGNLIVKTATEVVSTDCPSWMTSDMLLGWDGSAPSGQDWGCLRNLVPVQAQIITCAAQPAFSGSGADTFVTVSDSTCLEFPVTNADIDETSTIGNTIWIELQTGSIVSNRGIFEMVGNSANYAGTQLRSSSNAPRATYAGNNTILAITNGTLVIQDGVTWYSIGHSWVMDQAGADHAVVTEANGTWIEEDKGLNSATDGFVIPVQSVMAGARYQSASGLDYNVRKFAVVEGYKAPCPW